MDHVEELPREQLNTWAIVELFGHKKLAGKVTEQTIGAAALIRIDVPETKQEGDRFTKPYTKLVGAGSIYCITPCTEEVAHAAAQQIERWNQPIPVDLPARLPATASVAAEDAQLGDEFDDDEEL